jgi:hypothetical protein
VIRRALAWKIAIVLAPAILLFGLGLLMLSGAYLLKAQQDGAPTTDCGTGAAASFGTGAIAWPMPAGTYRLSSGYGPRGNEFHRGIDLAAPIGTPYYAAADGDVTEARPSTGFGFVIVVRHIINGQIVDTVYGHSHISTFKVKKGDRVKAGDQLAVVGNQGQATGPHLHFEVWPGGWNPSGTGSVDPAGWLDSNVQKGQTAPPPPKGQAAVDATLTHVTLTGDARPAGRQATVRLDKEQQRNVEAIVGAVKGMNQPLRVAVIAVATALQESSLRVLRHGDKAGTDSRGLYQQRKDWGPEDLRLDPVESTTLFLYGGQGGQRGLLDYDWQHQSLEDVVTQVQVSVGGYGKWEQQAVVLVAAAADVDPLTAGLGPTPTACGL